MKLKGKSAVITGGGRGIGKAIARAYLKEGADVLLVSRTEEELKKTEAELVGMGGRVMAVALDISRERSVKDLQDALERTFPDGIDILVAAAGIYGPIGSFHEVSVSEWKKTLEINLFGTFLSMRAVLPFMKRRGSGKIITFTGGGEGAYPSFSAYVASKGGVVRLTETVAEELRPLNIEVNAIAPGAVNTRLLDELLLAGPSRAGKATYERALRQKETGGVSPEKAAELSVFLASFASDGITGKLISAVNDRFEEFPNRLAAIQATDVYAVRRVKPKDRGYDWE